MSFDLALNRGDISIGVDGDLRKIRNTSKVAQDVLKVLHTPIGSNPLTPNIGSEVTTLNIGVNVNEQFAESRVEASILKSLEAVQAIQKAQARQQEVTPEETILNLSEVTAARDSKDPRQYNITITVITGGLTEVVIEPFTVQTQIIGE